MALYPIKLYFKNLPILFFGVVSLFVNVFIWIWLLWQIGPSPDPIFLHYNILFGVDYIGEWWRVLFLPIFGLLILLVNFLLGWLLFGRDKLLAYLLNAGALFCQLFLLVAACLLVFLNV
jgi:hypothetical protein